MTRSGAEGIFYQGLVHVAMGFHYLVAADFDGATATLRRAAEILEDFAPDFLGFDVERLRCTLASCRHRLTELGASRIAAFDRGLIPPLELPPHAGR